MDFANWDDSSIAIDGGVNSSPRTYSPEEQVFLTSMADEFNSSHPRFQGIRFDKDACFLNDFSLSLGSDSGISMLGPDPIGSSSLGSSVSSKHYEIGVVPSPSDNDWCINSQYIDVDQDQDQNQDQITTADSAKTLQPPGSAGVLESSSNEFLYDKSPFDGVDPAFMDVFNDDPNLDMSVFTVDGIGLDIPQNNTTSYGIDGFNAASVPLPSAEALDKFDSHVPTDMTAHQALIARHPDLVVAQQQEQQQYPSHQNPVSCLDDISIQIKQEEFRPPFHAPTSAPLSNVFIMHPSQQHMVAAMPTPITPSPEGGCAVGGFDPALNLNALSVDGLIQHSRHVNETRRFTNFEHHRWIPEANFGFHDFGPVTNDRYRPVWMRPTEAQVPALFVARLYPATDEDLGSSKNTRRSIEQRDPKKKKKIVLKEWDPKEVHYPLGYIPFQNWKHMWDLPEADRYSFNFEEFIREPKIEMNANGGREMSYERQNVPLLSNRYNKYDALYTREYESQSRECYCGICRTWHKRDQCNYLHHMKSAHGIRSCTKQRYPLPHIMAELPSTKSVIKIYLGFCDQCQSWNNINSVGAVNQYASWFLHQAMHDVQRNREQGCSGKKRSKKESLTLQGTLREDEKRARDKTKEAVRRLMAEDIRLNGNCNQFTGSFFKNPNNYEYTTDWQDVDGGP